CCSGRRPTAARSPTWRCTRRWRPTCSCSTSRRRRSDGRRGQRTEIRGQEAKQKRLNPFLLCFLTSDLCPLTSSSEVPRLGAGLLPRPRLRGRLFCRRCGLRPRSPHDRRLLVARLLRNLLVATPAALALRTQHHPDRHLRVREVVPQRLRQVA